MWRKIFPILIACACASTNAAAATLTLDVRDKDGIPVPNAVVALEPDVHSAVATRLPEKAIIDQRNETFVPFVVIVRKGGQVVFTNNDATMHQVYSFSPIAQFQLVVKPGEISPPVAFAQTGVAAIGCNIHDQMIAYVYVGDAPFAVVTDAKGRARIEDVPAGGYRASAWHAQLPFGAAAPSEHLAVEDSGAASTLTLPFSLAPMHGMKRMHMDY